MKRFFTEMNATLRGFLIIALIAGVVVVLSLQSVLATVVDTAPPVRGGGGSGLKDAMLDNGVKIRVGLLVDRGDKVRVDPETLEFKERVQD